MAWLRIEDRVVLENEQTHRFVNSMDAWLTRMAVPSYRQDRRIGAQVGQQDFALIVNCSPYRWTFVLFRMTFLSLLTERHSLVTWHVRFRQMTIWFAKHLHVWHESASVHSLSTFDEKQRMPFRFPFMHPYRIGPGLVFTSDFDSLNGLTRAEQDDQ